MKLLKILLFAVLLFGVLYLGATFYLSKNATGFTPNLALAEVDDLRNLHEQLAVFEQKINELQTQGKEYSDEEEAAEGLRERIQAVKEIIAAKAAGPVSAKEAHHFTLPTGAFFEDRFRLVFLGGLGALVCVIALLLAIGSLRKKKTQAVPKPGQQRQPRPQPQPPSLSQATPDLRATLEKFKAQQAAAPQAGGDSAEYKAVGKEALDDARERLKKKAELLGSLVGSPVGKPERGQAAADGSPVPDDLVEQVFSLHSKGFDVEYISEKLRVNQDQVRLILRFKR